jgi:putative transposase
VGVGWYSRGYLPHFDEPGLVQSLTFRLHDSMPQSVLERYREQMESGELSDFERHEKIESYLDAGHGACWLRRPEVARIVENAMFHGDGKRYRLISWCIMPNHVHALIELAEKGTLRGILHSWKSFTAQMANRHLQRRGVFWQREFHDRFMRDEKHLEAVRSYIEYNPVAAGLVSEARDWTCSSARRRGDGEA